MAARRHAPILGLLALFLLPVAYARAEPGEPSSPAATPMERAFDDLRSPLGTLREEAVQRLIEGLPEVRDEVIRRLQDAPQSVRLHLVEVLARDGSPEAVRALLEALREGPPLLAAHVRRVLVTDPEATRLIFAAWEADPTLKHDADGGVSPRVRELERLLERAETERIFLERKSESGFTGYYEGQYAALQPYRVRALTMVVGILLDRAVDTHAEDVFPTGGGFGVGNYEFLRPLPQRINFYELQDMAANAFTELASRKDVLYLAALDEERANLMSMGWIEREEEVRLADILLALYLVRGTEEDRIYLDAHLSELRSARRYNTYAGVLLRMHRYQEAIAAYQLALRRSREGFSFDPISKAHVHYNLACAYASYAKQLPERLRFSQLDIALNHLEQAVDEKWSDIRWTEQDNDLVLLRDLPRYRALLDRMREAVTPPSDEAPEEGGGSGR
ncbi:MAG: hypothetical protein ACYTG6_12755 [Planctomycetota bacterium]|jgi:tetratricopeptide (TPR) repeat protein